MFFNHLFLVPGRKQLYVLLKHLLAQTIHFVSKTYVEDETEGSSSL